jgi:hypothetical protein
MKFPKNLNKYPFLYLTFVLMSILVYRQFAPFGKEVTYSFVKALPGAEEITTSVYASAEPLRLAAQLIKNKTSRFSLKADKAKLEQIGVNLKFKPGQKEILIGVRGDEKQAFVYQPIYFAPLETIGWPVVSEKGLYLYQKNKKFNTVADFLKNMPMDKKIATYEVDPNRIQPVSTLPKETGKFSLPFPIRGNHSLYILATNQPLEIKISKQDLNGSDGEDKLKLQLFRGQNLVIEKTLGDDGISDKSQLKALPQEFTLKVEKPEPGIYRLDLVVDAKGSDLTINKIEINQKKVVFNKDLNVVGDKVVTFYTSSNKLTMTAGSDKFLQTLKINDKTDLQIKKAKEKGTVDLSKIEKKKDELFKVTSPKSNITFSSDGVYAMTADGYFLPAIANSVDLSDFTDFEEINANVDYILTTLPPVKSGDWIQASVNIDPKLISIAKDSVFFSLEIPELDKHGGSLEIAAMDIILKDRAAATPTPVPTKTLKSTVKPTIVPSKKTTPTVEPELAIPTLVPAEMGQGEEEIKPQNVIQKFINWVKWLFVRNEIPVDEVTSEEVGPTVTVTITATITPAASTISGSKVTPTATKAPTATPTVKPTATPAPSTTPAVTKAPVPTLSAIALPTGANSNYCQVTNTFKIGIGGSYWYKDNCSVCTCGPGAKISCDSKNCVKKP